MKDICSVTFLRFWFLVSENPVFGVVVFSVLVFSVLIFGASVLGVLVFQVLVFGVLILPCVLFLDYALTINIKVQYKRFLLINFCNSNTESEQLSTYSIICSIFNRFDDITNKNIVFGEDFNLFFEAFESKLKALGGSPFIKQKIKVMLDLRDIWRITNPKFKRDRFR